MTLFLECLTLFYLPECSNGSNCLVPGNNDRIAEMRTQHKVTENAGEDTQEENLFQKFFWYVIDNKGIEYPNYTDEAILLFSYLIEKAGEIQ